MLHPNFVIVGTLIGAISSIFYLVDTVKGNVQPNRVSFLLWSIAPLIAFAAQIKQGIGMESLMTFSVGFLPFIIFIATFFNKKSVWKLSTFDIVCGILSIIGLILWLITKVGNIAIIFSIVADMLAAIPTIIKAYKYPDTESAWPWLGPVIGVLFTILTLKELTFTNSGFILYISFVNTLIFVLVQFRLGEKIAKRDSSHRG